jgi:hypothetical protein
MIKVGEENGNKPSYRSPSSPPLQGDYSMNVEEEKVIELIKNYFIPNAPEHAIRDLSEVWMLESELTDYMNRKEEIKKIIDKYLKFHSYVHIVLDNLIELWLDKKISDDVFREIRGYFIKMDYNMKERLINHLNERCRR